MVSEGSRQFRFGPCACLGIMKSGVYSVAIAANPNVVFVIDCDSVHGIRPVVALARTAPVSDKVSGRIELENGRGCLTAIGKRRIRAGVRFLLFERAASMNDPDIVMA